MVFPFDRVFQARLDPKCPISHAVILIMRNEMVKVFLFWQHFGTCRRLQCLNHRDSSFFLDRKK